MIAEQTDAKEVFRFFKEICNIPHGSGNTAQISDYLVAFAKERHLFYQQDAMGNVIIIKEASKGSESRQPLMIQGHMDMVTVQKPDCSIDMKKEGLRLKEKDGFLYAEGTSLGGDDGIAVAIGLALLNDEQLQHPRLELVVTVDEEVGMEGAHEIDLSVCTANRMLNLDHDEEDTFLCGCAGGAKVSLTLPLQMMQPMGNQECYTIKLGGLQGGHSGTEIDKGHGNANCLLGRVLFAINQQVTISLVAISGGVADNAIPRETSASFVVNDSNWKGSIEAICKKLEEELQQEWKVKEPRLQLSAAKITGQKSFATTEDTDKAICLLCSVPNGVQQMSAEIENMVETSLNLGIISLYEGNLTMEFAVRSSVESAKKELVNRLKAVARLSGAFCKITGEYPGWEYKEDSQLRRQLSEVYEKEYGQKPQIKTIHAGLECGVLIQKKPNLDCVAAGPEVLAIHTTEERLNIMSTVRFYHFVRTFIEEY